MESFHLTDLSERRDGSLFSKDPDLTVGRMRFENPLAEVKGYH